MATQSGLSRHIVIALPRLAVLQHGDQFFATSVGQGWAAISAATSCDASRSAITEEGIDYAARKPALTGNNAASALDHGAGIDGSVGTRQRLSAECRHAAPSGCCLRRHGG